MVKYVILTVIYRKQQFDMELPADVPIKRLLPSLITALQSKGFIVPASVELLGNGRRLDASETLLDAGVWDGSYLELKDIKGIADALYRASVWH